MYELVKNAAEEAMRVIDSHDQIRITSSYHNNIGIYLAVDVIDILEVELAMENVNLAGGYNISALICTESLQCCNVGFGDLGPGSISSQKPTNCDDFQLDDTIGSLLVIR